MEWVEQDEPPALIPVEDMEKAHPVYEQNEETLQAWIDPHKLKKIEGTWYKDGRRVVTDDLDHKRALIKSHHDPPVYGHLGINRTVQLLERYVLLVAPATKRRRRLCLRLHRMSTAQSQYTSHEGTT